MCMCLKVYESGKGMHEYMSMLEMAQCNLEKLWE